MTLAALRSHSVRMTPASLYGGRYPHAPMNLANMRENGVRWLSVECRACRHSASVNVDAWPGEVEVPSGGPAVQMPVRLEGYRRAPGLDEAGAQDADGPEMTKAPATREGSGGGLSGRLDAHTSAICFRKSSGHP